MSSHKVYLTLEDPRKKPRRYMLTFDQYSGNLEQIEIEYTRSRRVRAYRDFRHITAIYIAFLIPHGKTLNELYHDALKRSGAPNIAHN